MPKNEPPRPTDAELSILRVLWQRGPSTVREVQESLNESRPTGYTTVLKTLQIMTEKGLVRRDEQQRAHVYEAQFAQQQHSGKLLAICSTASLTAPLPICSCTRLPQKRALHQRSFHRSATSWMSLSEVNDDPN